MKWIKVEDRLPEVDVTVIALTSKGKVMVTSMYDYGYPDTDCYVKVNPKKNMIHVNGRNANSNIYSHSFCPRIAKSTTALRT